MPSFRITLSPSRRAASRYIGKVRRAIQQALAEDNVTQSDLARIIGVHRSVISREIRGHKDITLGRVGELAFALGRKPVFVLQKQQAAAGTNVAPARIEMTAEPSSNVLTKLNPTPPAANLTVILEAA